MVNKEHDDLSKLQVKEKYVNKISSYLKDHSASFQNSTWYRTHVFGKSTSEVGRTYYHLRNKDEFLVPKTECKTFEDRAFFTSGPILWNSLPDNIREIANLQKLKKKTYIFCLDLPINEHQSFTSKE